MLVHVPSIAAAADPSAWLALVPSYLLGAVPFGFVLCKLLRGIDLREFGSGNIGSTNAMRALGKPLGVVAFLLDFAKGAVPVLVFAPLGARWAGAQSASGWLAVGCGAAAVCGHVWPVYLRFRGGKAVATGCGAIAAIDPIVVLGGAVAWVLALLVTRYASVASIAMTLAFPLLAAWRAAQRGEGGELVWGTAALALLVLVRHRANLGRLMAGTEPRIGRGGAAQEREKHA